MPKQVRKRGKKHRGLNPSPYDKNPPEAPSIVTEEKSKPVPNHKEDAPFGLVDPDVKAYLRTIDSELQVWNTTSPGTSSAPLDRQTEQRDLPPFYQAALKEISGKELALATDSDCSIILERMLYLMDDFSLRVFMDSLAGSIFQLCNHRFASHVCQTCFELIPKCVDRESRGRHPNLTEGEAGELRSMTDLVLDIVQELLPCITSMVTNQFGSHVLQSLLLCLIPTLPVDFRNETIRSHKSQKWKAKQLTAVAHPHANDRGGVTSTTPLSSPPSFNEAASMILETLRGQMNCSEVKSLAGNPASSPVLQCLIKVEAHLKRSDEPGGFMDQILDGLIGRKGHEDGRAPHSDFVFALLRDPVGSHLFEAVIGSCANDIFDSIWQGYIIADLGKLALHPISNFAVAACVSRLSDSAMSIFWDKMCNLWHKAAQSGRCRVLLAALDRSRNTTHCSSALDALRTAFQLSSPESLLDVVPTLLGLETPKMTQAVLGDSPGSALIKPDMQGSLLLQSMLRMSEFSGQIVVQSLEHLQTDRLVLLAQNAISSRVIDAVFESDVVSKTAKRQLILSFVASYHQLAQDRIGSRIAERCWGHADVFSREKIVRALKPHENELLQSYYGKYFIRSIDLPLFRRNPGTWRERQKLRTV